MIIADTPMNWFQVCALVQVSAFRFAPRTRPAPRVESMNDSNEAVIAAPIIADSFPAGDWAASSAINRRQQVAPWPFQTSSSSSWVFAAKI